MIPMDHIGKKQQPPADVSCSMCRRREIDCTTRDVHVIKVLKDSRRRERVGAPADYAERKGRSGSDSNSNSNSDNDNDSDESFARTPYDGDDF